MLGRARRLGPVPYDAADTGRPIPGGATALKICLSCEGVSDTAAERCGNCAAWLLPTDCVHYPARRGEAEGANPLLGTVIDGKYRLQSVLGRGGLGTVFEAVHTGSLLQVAVKLLHPRFSERPEYRRALLPEARRAATIAHERCARLLDVGETEDGATYLAMELVVGETLEQVLRDGPLRPGHALLILTQIAEALVAIHAAGLVHCDLSPRNVMVALRDGRLLVKVLDFGIARTVSLAGAERSRGGEFTGFVNPVFAAPEQLAGQPVDARADLYAFGVLGRLLLTGELPVAAVDPRQAAQAVIAGELRPWPGRPGEARALQRLLQACLQREKAARPASAALVLRELQRLAAPRHPALGSAAVGLLALVVVLWLWTLGRQQAPFLWPVAGSGLDLDERLPGPGAPVQSLPSRRLATLSFHYGGFAPARLHVDLSRDGVPLRRLALQPECDDTLGIATLSTAQPGWRELLASLLGSSREGPVDVAFAVPGGPPLAAARVRLDDEPPVCEIAFTEDRAPLVGDSLVQVRIADAGGLAGAWFEVRLANGRQARLDWTPRVAEFALGRALLDAWPGVADLGPGELWAEAVDAAGNTGRSAALGFSRCDLAAPAVLELQGPAGENYLPVVGETVRARVHLSAAEPGTTLHLGGDSAALPRLAELRGSGEWQVLTMPRAALIEAADAGIAELVVVDAVGNQSHSQHALALRERSVGLRLVADAPGVAVLGAEAVVAETGGVLLVQHRPGFRLLSAAVDGGAPVVVEPLREATAARVQLPRLDPGPARLRLRFAETGSSADPQEDSVPVRVLPAEIEVRLPEAPGRFLADFLQAGSLSRQGRGVVDGAGWRWPGELRPYLVGRLWTGLVPPLALPIAGGEPGSPLLPEVPLGPGRSRLALELRDVLGRPARVVGPGGPLPTVMCGTAEAAVIADFWWDETPPEPIGEELQVELGQPTRWRVRLPVPYLAAEAGRLRLSLAQTALPAVAVVPAGSGAIATFELPFAALASAAQLEGLSRAAFANQLERRVLVTLRTPCGAADFELRLRTARSTLRPVRLGELAALPAGLAEARMVPVLGLEQPFCVVLPQSAPPQSLYRPPGPAAVRAIGDCALLAHECTWGMARAMLASLGTMAAPPASLVHADDPLGTARLSAARLVPAASEAAPDDALLTGVDFFQAYALCRLLGWLCAGDPDLFRLPLGCELELAAFAGAGTAACNGPAAARHPVLADPFLGGMPRPWRCSVADLAAAGDRLHAGTDGELLGLDFGAREWVGDLPYFAEGGLLLAEWMSDHGAHLARVAAFAAGEAPPSGLAAPLRSLGVVRGLAFGEADGLLGADGRPLGLQPGSRVPATVPGVLRAEQLRRDGRDLVTSGVDRRLERIGFRIAGGERFLAWSRGQR